MRTGLDYLIKLLDDPDPEVYHNVSQRILIEGNDAIEFLEEASWTANSTEHFERISILISEIKLRDLSERLKQWINSGEPDLTEGLLMISELLEPDASADKIRSTLTNLKNEIWLELSDRLTAIEKINILNGFFFSKWNFVPENPAIKHPKYFYLSRFLSEKWGGEEIVLAVYLIIARKLGLPVFMVDVPGLTLLAWLDLPVSPGTGFIPGKSPALFFIHPREKGRMFGIDEVRYFLSKVYPEYRHEDISCLSDIKMVETFIKAAAAACHSAGKKELEKKFKTLLSLW